MTELVKLAPLAAALAQLQKALRPGRRLTNLKRNFHDRWVVEHQYVRDDGGRFHCTDKQIMRDKLLPVATVRPASLLRVACSGLTAVAVAAGSKPTPQHRNEAKRNRRLLRAAGGVYGPG
jgi:hypothetical protein